MCIRDRTSIIDAVTPIAALLIASLTSVSEVAPVVKDKVEDVPLPVNAGPAAQVPRSIVRLSMPISPVVDEKPLPLLSKFRTCPVAMLATLIVCENSLARLLSVRLNLTLLVLEDRASPIWPSSAVVFV